MGADSSGDAGTSVLIVTVKCLALLTGSGGGLGLDLEEARICLRESIDQRKFMSSHDRETSIKKLFH